MKLAGINKNNTNPAFKGGMTIVHNKIANTFAKMDGIGEGASIAFDFIGKAAVVPAVIMLASDEPTEKKEYSALKNPVAAVIQLLMEVPILLLGSKAIEKGANNGFFDTPDAKLYNEKFYKDTFISTLKNSKYQNQNEAQTAKNLIKSIEDKGLARKITENIDDFIEALPGGTKDTLKQTFSEYKTAHKRLFHLQNRLCFIAAIIMTPVLCALENKLHPVIMDKIYERQKTEAGKKASHSMLSGNSKSNLPNIHRFIKMTSKGTIKQ